MGGCTHIAHKVKSLIRSADTSRNRWSKKERLISSLTIWIKTSNKTIIIIKQEKTQYLESCSGNVSPQAIAQVCILHIHPHKVDWRCSGPPAVQWMYPFSSSAHQPVQKRSQQCDVNMVKKNLESKVAQNRKTLWISIPPNRIAFQIYSNIIGLLFYNSTVLS